MNTSARTVSRVLQFALFSMAACFDPQSVVHADAPHDMARSSLKVSFADLDLTSRQGTVTLYRRIRAAARTVCGFVDIDLPDDVADWERCVNDAIANAVAQVGNANLTDYYLAKGARRITVAKR